MPLDSNLYFNYFQNIGNACLCDLLLTELAKILLSIIEFIFFYVIDILYFKYYQKAFCTTLVLCSDVVFESRPWTNFVSLAFAWTCLSVSELGLVIGLESSGLSGLSLGFSLEAKPWPWPLGRALVFTVIFHCIN